MNTCVTVPPMVLHLPTKMLFIISFCKSLLVNSNIYIPIKYIGILIFIYRLSVIYQFEKKTGDGYTYTLRIHYRSHACISMYNLSENRKHALACTFDKFRESLEMALIIIF